MNNAPTKDTRIACQFCGVKTWRTDYAEFMRDHDRPQGGRCLRAAEVYNSAKAIRGPKTSKPRF